MSTSFFEVLKAEAPLKVFGTPSPLCALMAQQAGFKAIYLSGGGLANYTYGVPDTGLTTLANVVAEAEKITRHKLITAPLLVDVDTGWDDPAHTARAMVEAGVKAIHIEDQTEEKRCGHIDGKSIITEAEMVTRLKESLKGRGESDLFIFARTDATGEEAIERAKAYAAAGADGIFAEAVGELADYKKFKQAVDIPILANITEFGKTPLYTPAELASVGADVALYPRTGERVMLKGYEDALLALQNDGSIQKLVDTGHIYPRHQTNELINYDVTVETKQVTKEAKT